MAITITPDKEIEKNNIEIVMQKNALDEVYHDEYVAQKEVKEMTAKEIGDSVKEKNQAFLKDVMELQQQADDNRAKQPSDGKLKLIDVDTTQDAKALLVEGLIGELIKEINETLEPEEKITLNQQKKIVTDIHKGYSKMASNKKTSTPTQNNITKDAFKKHASKAYKKYKNNAPIYTKEPSQERRDNVQQNNEPDTKFEKIDRLAFRAYISPESIMNFDPNSMAYLISRCGIFNNPFRMQPQPMYRTAKEEANEQIDKINTFLNSI